MSKQRKEPDHLWHHSYSVHQDNNNEEREKEKESN